MPDDFVRVFWLLLTVSSDSEGRSIDNASWLRSKMFPMRDDVKSSQINGAVEWLANRGMIVRYSVNGRSYFYIPTFKMYQSGTDKEGKSVLPEPPDIINNNSEPTQEPVQNNSEPTQEPVRVNTNTESIQHKAKPAGPVTAFPDKLNCTEFMEAWIEWDTYRIEKKQRLTPSTIKKQLAFLSKFTVDTAIAIIDKSITKGWLGLFEIENNGSHGGNGKTMSRGMEELIERAGDQNEIETAERV
jgi:hypothetical protein